MSMKVVMAASDGTLVSFDGYYKLTQVFIPNTWSSPDSLVSHALNEEISNETDKQSWCGSEWVPSADLSDGSEVIALCLECTRLAEEYYQ